MIPSSQNGMFTIIITFIIAIALLLFPLPDYLLWWRPNLALMVLIYWIMALPHKIGIFSAWFLGIITDVTLGSVLGVHGISMAIIAYVIFMLSNRLRLFPLWQQALTVSLMIGLDLVLSLWIQNFISTQPRYGEYWSPIISSIFIWPLVLFLLRYVRRTFHVR
ncbi:MAG: rod shape-determining protein MreD [Gammaproteobacteria bacterium]|nr:rod shape-determining protein MreD [Gammaproteobacteria bacterium]